MFQKSLYKISSRFDQNWRRYVHFSKNTFYRYRISRADKKAQEETKEGRILRRQRQKVILDILENGPLLYGAGIDDSVRVEKNTNFYIYRVIQK